MNGELQRQSQEARRFARRFDQLDEPQRFPVGAEQDMQAVVESGVPGFDAAGAAMPA